MKKLNFKRTFPELKGKGGKINFNQESKKISLDFTNPLVCEKWIDSIHKSKGIKYSYGGFLEDRSNFFKEHYNKKDKLFIHLGVDYVVPEGTKVFLTEEAVVKDIMFDRDQNGGWGKRVAFSIRDNSAYLLYGHLKKEIRLKVGQKCKPGVLIGFVGNLKENGGWFPHLHVQLMTKNFLSLNKNDFKKIDGYAKKGSKLIKEVLDPTKIIFS
jgi:murein DD-endopeptidase MepM/ murein hydrolase activator NlpD